MAFPESLHSKRIHKEALNYNLKTVIKAYHQLPDGKIFLINTYELWGPWNKHGKVDFRGSSWICQSLEDS